MTYSNSGLSVGPGPLRFGPLAPPLYIFFAHCVRPPRGRADWASWRYQRRRAISGSVQGWTTWASPWDYVAFWIDLLECPICCKDSGNLTHCILLNETVEETAVLASDSGTGALVQLITVLIQKAIIEVDTILSGRVAVNNLSPSQFLPRLSWYIISPTT